MTQAVRNRRTFSLSERPVINFFNGKGNFVSENLSGFKHKVNEMTKEELREAKGVVWKNRRHNWENGSHKGDFETTNNHYMKFNAINARKSAIPLTEEYKNNLKDSQVEFGKGKVPLISTQFNSYVPINNFKRIKNVSSLKDSSINFNPNFSGIKKASVYAKDF